MSASEIIEQQMTEMRCRLVEQAETIGEVRECIRRVELLAKGIQPSNDGTGMFIPPLLYGDIVGAIERASRIVK